jgi:uncharacterized protein YebE (UPF0316 family)
MTVDMLFASAWGAALIMALRVVDVSLDTMRVIFAIRGKRGIAAMLGFVQALIWIFAVGNAVRHLDSILHVLGYAGGYALGTFVGVTIERAIAYGVAMVRIVSRHGGVEIAEALRDRGFGVTEFAGFGRDGSVEILNTVVQRSQIPEVVALVERWDSSAFVTVEEPRVLQGGSVTAREWRVAAPVVDWMRGRQGAATSTRE